MGKKLIEVALPLDAINRGARQEKNPFLKGHPRSLHLWWARRPLSTCRAILFSSLVDDPEDPEAPPEYLAEIDKLPGKGSRRDKLFEFITKLVKWENSNDKKILGTARKLIQTATDGNPPPVLDPFCGGGSIPLEAQRLGLTVYASDLNPVAVLITKALVEIPSKFAGLPPVNPDAQQTADLHKGTWEGAQGLAEDVRYYGQFMRDEAEKGVGHLYAKGPNGETVIAWLWARTVTCPNPACGAEMPLVSSFWLSKKKGKRAWIEPIVDYQAKTVDFEVHTGEGSPPEPPKIGRGAKFRCLVCGNTAPDEHIKDEGMGRRMSAQLMAVVLEGDNGRGYVSPSDQLVPGPLPMPDTTGLDAKLNHDPRAIWCVAYGLETYPDLFTRRQLVALTTLSDLVGEAREKIQQDALAAGMSDDDQGIEDGGTGAQGYADAVATYVSFGLDHLVRYCCALVAWNSTNQNAGQVFGRQGLPMVWDPPSLVF